MAFLRILGRRKWPLNFGVVYGWYIFYQRVVNDINKQQQLYTRAVQYILGQGLYLKLEICRTSGSNWGNKTSSSCPLSLNKRSGEGLHPGVWELCCLRSGKFRLVAVSIPRGFGSGTGDIVCVSQLLAQQQDFTPLVRNDDTKGFVFLDGA